MAVGYISRRAMLQQLHGISSLSHDERHCTAHTWMNKGKTQKRWLHFYPSMSVEVSFCVSVRQVGCKLEVFQLLLNQEPSTCTLLLLAGILRSVQCYEGDWFIES